MNKIFFAKYVEHWLKKKERGPLKRANKLQLKQKSKRTWEISVPWESHGVCAFRFAVILCLQLITARLHIISNKFTKLTLKRPFTSLRHWECLQNTQTPRNVPRSREELRDLESVWPSIQNNHQKIIKEKRESHHWQTHPGVNRTVAYSANLIWQGRP